MATIAKLTSRIKVRLSRRTSVQYDAEIVDALDHAQVEILEKSPTLPNYLQFKEIVAKGAGHFTIVAGDLTRTMIRFWDEKSLYYSDTTVTSPGDEFAIGEKLKRIKRYDDPEQLDQLYPGTGEAAKGFFQGSPEQEIIIRPYVTVAADYAIYYYGNDPNLPSAPDGSGFTLWSRYDGDLLMHTAGVELAEYLRDTRALEYFSAKRQEAHTRFLRRVEAEKLAGTELVMGD